MWLPNAGREQYRKLLHEVKRSIALGKHCKQLNVRIISRRQLFGEKLWFQSI